jgi:hypothetical protein
MLRAYGWPGQPPLTASMLRKPAAGRKPAADGDRRHKKPGVLFGPRAQLSLPHVANRGELAKEIFCRSSSSGHFRPKYGSRTIWARTFGSGSVPR